MGRSISLVLELGCIARQNIFEILSEFPGMSASRELSDYVKKK